MAMVEGKRSNWRVWLTHLLLIAVAFGMLWPVFTTLSISFRPGDFVYGSLLPENPTLDHFKYVLGFDMFNSDGTLWEKRHPVLLWIWNSVKISAVASVILLVFSSLAAYAFARLQFRGSNNLLTGLMILQMFPSFVSLIAIRVALDKLGFYVPALGIGSHGSMMLIYMGAVIGEIWLIKGYMESIDPAIGEAARVDGAKPMQLFRYIYLPLSLPILAVNLVLSFNGIYGEVAIASMMLTDPDAITMAVGIKTFIWDYNIRWGDFAAASILGALPITLVFLFAQRWMIEGLTAGSVKG